MNYTARTILAIIATAATTAFSQAPAPSASATAQKPKDPIMQIDDLLSKSGAFFLATADGDQPKLRPLGAHHVVNGKVWLGVGEFKNVYRQLAANPKCEVVALQPEGGKWLRWTGRASFAEGAEREKLEEIFVNAMPHLRKIYDKTPGKRMMCFTLVDARAELIPLMPPGEILLDETAGDADVWDKTFPKSDKVEHSKVSFKNRFGITLVGDVYKPKTGNGGKFAAVALSGPFGAVKEQVSGRYAQALAERGFLTVAFDPSFTGESGGAPRDINSPDINTDDFGAAVDYLLSRDDVDPAKVGICGICGWGGFALNAAAIDTRVKATVAVTMYDMSRVTAKGYNDSADTPAARKAMREAMNAQRTADFKGGTVTYAAVLPNPEDLTDDTSQFVKDYVSFYKTPRGFHKRSPGSTHGWAATAGLSLLNTKLLAYAGEIEGPVLLVHGEKAHSRFFSETALEILKAGIAPDNKRLLLVPDAVHCDLYDNLGKMPFDAIAAFFRNM